MTSATPEGSAGTVADSYQHAFGRAPEGVWSAPGRVNLIGEHLDYNDGPVLPFAIAARTFVAAGRRSDGLLSLRSLQQPETGPVETPVDTLRPGGLDGWPAYVAGVVWALAERGVRTGGLDVLVDGHVPVGAGLSSSAALECATALAVADLGGIHVAKADLARAARRAENDFVGVPCGLMDQMASVACTVGHAILFDTRDETVEQVPLDVRTHGATLLVVDTRVHHELADGAYADRTRTCRRAADALGVSSLRSASADQVERLHDDLLRRRARHVVTEIARVEAAVAALRAADLATLGAAMSASHVSLRDDYEVSCVELDTAVDAALGAGALGARMTGGGFGGSAVVLAPDSSADAIADSVRAAAAAAGHPEPRVYATVASAGAHRDR